jgi:large subunit ribosomal protein L21
MAHTTGFKIDLLLEVSMYAIIRTGGKQYTVRAGDTLRVEKLPRELGAEFDVDEVLLVGGEQLHVGEPTVKNAKVTLVVTQQAKAPKVIVFKKKRRQGYRRLHGHRQLFTELFVKTITAPTGETAEAEKSAIVIDPAKKLARLAKLKADGKKLVVKKAVKKVAKTAAPKKTTKTKSAGKKSGAKKATTTKKKASK